MIEIVLGLILGVIIAACFTFMITTRIVRKSNDMGNSKGSFSSFAGSNIRIINKRDGVSPNRWR